MGLLVGWLVCWSVVRSVRWLVGRSVGRLVGLSIYIDTAVVFLFFANVFALPANYRHAVDCIRFPFRLVANNANSCVRKCAAAHESPLGFSVFLGNRTALHVSGGILLGKMWDTVVVPL